MALRKRHADLVKRLRERAAKAHPRATAAMIAAAEEEFGFRLPPLLRAVYRLVGNGGFGPGGGLVGVPGTEPYLSTADSIMELYEREMRGNHDGDPADRWPAKLVPICDYGCGNFACVDCSRPAGRVLRFDCDAYLMMARPRRGKALRPGSESLAGWFEDWFERVANGPRYSPWSPG
jgi:hypothetical protein